MAPQARWLSAGRGGGTAAAGESTAGVCAAGGSAGGDCDAAGSVAGDCVVAASGGEGWEAAGTDSEGAAAGGSGSEGGAATGSGAGTDNGAAAGSGCGLTGGDAASAAALKEVRTTAAWGHFRTPAPAVRSVRLSPSAARSAFTSATDITTAGTMRYHDRGRGLRRRCRRCPWKRPAAPCGLQPAELCAPTLAPAATGSLSVSAAASTNRVG